MNDIYWLISYKLLKPITYNSYQLIEEYLLVICCLRRATRLGSESVSTKFLLHIFFINMVRFHQNSSPLASPRKSDDSRSFQNAYLFTLLV